MNQFYISVLFVYLCFFGWNLSAKEMYVPGYVITISGDSISGLVDYQNWEKNPFKIKFKQNGSGQEIRYNPQQIKRFGLSGEIYISAEVDTEVSSVKINTLSYTSNPEIERKWVFLQVLVQGDRSLYYYKAPDGKDNFYIWHNDEFQLLVYKKYLSNSNGREVTKQNNRYKGILRLYFKDYEAIHPKIDRCAYNKESLIRVFIGYYEQSHKQASFVKQKDKTKIEFGALAGASLSSLEFYRKGVSDDMGSSTNMSLGLSMDIILPRNHGRWSINNELLYSKYSVSSTAEVEGRDYYDVRDVSYAYIKLNNMLRYSFPIKSFGLFANVGISNGFAISETQTTTRYTTDGELHNGPDDLLNDTRKYEQGWLAGIGARYNRFSFEVRQERSNGMSEYLEFETAVKRMYFLLAYKF